MNEPTLEEVMGVWNARLCVASGMVRDSDRLVAFLYLLLRDVVPVNRLSEPLQENALVEFAPDSAPEWPQDVLDRAARLSDAPTDRLRDFIARIKPLLAQGTWERLEELLPLRNDVDTTFANGWVALYAKWIALNLCRP